MNQAHMEVGTAIRWSKLNDMSKFTHRFVEHASPIEGDAQVAMLIDPHSCNFRTSRRGTATNVVNETGSNESVECLTGIKFR